MIKLLVTSEFNVDVNDIKNTVLALIIIIIYIYLPSDVISQEKTATSSRSITKASKYAIPLKPTHKLANSKRYLVTWWGDSEGPKGHLSLLPPHQVKVKKAASRFSQSATFYDKKFYAKLKCCKDMYTLYSVYTKLTVTM